MDNTALPDTETIYRWIEDVYTWGVRRPGYEADVKAEEYALEHFREMGLQDVRSEDVRLPHWSFESATLTVRGNNQSFDVPCFPLPHCASTDRIELKLREFDAGQDCGGTCALTSHPLMRVPATMVLDGEAVPGQVRDELVVTLNSGGAMLDPGGSLASCEQILPFSPLLQNVMEPAIEAGASAFIGVLDQYPGDSHKYYVPYDGMERPIPGVWISGSEGDRIRSLMAMGEVLVDLEIKSSRSLITSHNIIGELPGADTDYLVVGSHHDGPWSSAVEDASGISMVLAQAHYWSRQPAAARPHHMLFLLNAGHMAGGAGCLAFIEQHRSMLDQIVLAIHLEHVAGECREENGRIVPTGEPETRWFFTTQLPHLTRSVYQSLQAEGIDRALIIPPDTFGDRPTTDGGAFHLEQVPLMNFLTAPYYLFDESDTLDKIHKASLVPITRAVVRMIEDTRAISATDMRRQPSQ
jgi:Peptidase family M28